ncbi:MAG: (Fe-S)-binding protein, partial [Candidatus Latescibacterota bacterium]
MKHEVVVVRCEDYGHLPEALREGLEELGGAGRFFGPAERIFLKPNLMGPHPPEEAVTTHPSLVEHMTRTIRQVG